MKKLPKLAPAEVRALTDHLGQIPDLYGQLPTIDEPDRTDPGEPNDTGGTSTKPGSSAPLNLTVVHLTDTRHKPGWRRHDPGRVATIHRLGTLPALYWWTQTIEPCLAAAGVTIPDHTKIATVASECAWLAQVTTFVLAQPWAPLYVRDIAKIQQRLTEAATGTREWTPRCGQCAVDSKVVDLEPQDEGAWWKCPHCSKEYTPGAMSDLGRRQPPLPADQIAAALSISETTIRVWKIRGYLTPAKHDRGRPLYHLADVRRVKERVRERRAGKDRT